jgi:hypothetical protein
MDKVFNQNELLFLKSLDNPNKVQDFIDTLEYNKGSRVSVVDVLRKQKADCLEASVFASMVFRLNGIKSFIIDLEAIKDDDHVICVYKKKKLFGSVAQSKYLGLKAKHPVYKNIRELSMSYYEHFFNYDGVLDLLKRSKPVFIQNIGPWVSSIEFMCEMEEILRNIKHYYLVPRNQETLKVTSDVFRREILKIPKKAKIGKEYIEASRQIPKI